MIDSDRYLRDSCLSIIASMTVEDLTELTVEVPQELSKADTKRYVTKYLDQWRVARKLLVEKCPSFSGLEWAVEKCLRNLDTKYQWNLPIRPSQLYIAIGKIDFVALKKKLAKKAGYDSVYGLDSDVYKAVHACLIKRRIVTEFQVEPAGKYVAQCRQALNSLIETVPLLDRLKSDIYNAIRILNLKNRWPGVISTENVYLALAAIDFTDELNKLVEVELGAGKKSYRFKKQADVRSLNAKIAKSFLEWGFIVPKDKK